MTGCRPVLAFFLFLHITGIVPECPDARIFLYLTLQFICNFTDCL